MTLPSWLCPRTLRWLADEILAESRGAENYAERADQRGDEEAAEWWRRHAGQARGRARVLRGRATRVERKRAPRGFAHIEAVALVLAVGFAVMVVCAGALEDEAREAAAQAAYAEELATDELRFRIIAEAERDVAIGLNAYCIEALAAGVAVVTAPSGLRGVDHCPNERDCFCEPTNTAPSAGKARR